MDIPSCIQILSSPMSQDIDDDSHPPIHSYSHVRPVRFFLQAARQGNENVEFYIQSRRG